MDTISEFGGSGKSENGNQRTANDNAGLGYRLKGSINLRSIDNRIRQEDCKK